MQSFNKRFLSSALCLATLFASACASFKLKDPPRGFAEVESWDGYARFKSGDDVGVNISSFHNVEGGTLAFWSEDLIEKLGGRGYVLENQSPVESKNGVVGTRFDFSYETPAEGHHKFFNAVLFATDKKRVVIQLAGVAELGSKYAKQTDEIARDIKVRGCRGKDICRGEQPGKLSTPGPVKAAEDDAAGDEAEDEAGDEAKSEPPSEEPTAAPKPTDPK